MQRGFFTFKRFRLKKNLIRNNKSLLKLFKSQTYRDARKNQRAFKLHLSSQPLKYDTQKFTLFPISHRRRLNAFDKANERNEKCNRGVPRIIDNINKSSIPNSMPAHSPCNFSFNSDQKLLGNVMS